MSVEPSRDTMTPGELIAVIETACKPWSDRALDRPEAAVIVRQFGEAFADLSQRDAVTLQAAKRDVERTRSPSDPQFWTWFVLARALVNISRFVDVYRLVVDDALHLGRCEVEHHATPYALSLATIYDLPVLTEAALRLQALHATARADAVIVQRARQLVSHSILVGVER